MAASDWNQELRMKIRVGFEMIYDFPQPTPLIAVLGTHFTRASDLIVPDHLTSPSVPITQGRKRKERPDFRGARPRTFLKAICRTCGIFQHGRLRNWRNFSKRPMRSKTRSSSFWDGADPTRANKTINRLSL
jgi:hypothetical protein